MSAPRVVVLGGTGYVGQAVCELLAGRGARVAFTFHRAEGRARELSDALPGSIARRLDLCRTADIGPTMEALADALGEVDALVHVAGLASTCEPPRFDRLEDLEDAGWDRLMAVNVKGPAFACRHLAARFSDTGGNVVLLGSIEGVKPVPTPMAYAASKAALTGMARALAKELGDRNIRVNVVAPGVLESGASDALPAELRAEFLKHSALKRFGTAAEVAEMVAFFALENRYVTGRTLLVDGGL